MASENVLRQADFHRNTMRTLVATRQHDEIHQVASAVVDVMAWLDANYTDLQELFKIVSNLESSIENTNDKIRILEDKIKTLEVRLHN